MLVWENGYLLEVRKACFFLRLESINDGEKYIRINKVHILFYMCFSKCPDPLISVNWRNVACDRRRFILIPVGLNLLLSVMISAEGELRSPMVPVFHHFKCSLTSPD